eukprot:2514038-Rhodomonas_salina.1
MAQALMEVKSSQFEDEVSAHKATRQKVKKMKEEINEQADRIQATALCLRAVLRSPGSDAANGASRSKTT